MCLTPILRGKVISSTLADLRDSGRIEEDSDIVITLYRDEVQA